MESSKCAETVKSFYSLKFKDRELGKEGKDESFGKSESWEKLLKKRKKFENCERLEKRLRELGRIVKKEIYRFANLEDRK